MVTGAGPKPDTGSGVGNLATGDELFDLVRRNLVDGSACGAKEQTKTRAQIFDRIRILLVFFVGHVTGV